MTKNNNFGQKIKCQKYKLKYYFWELPIIRDSKSKFAGTERADSSDRKRNFWPKKFTRKFDRPNNSSNISKCDIDDRRMSKIMSIFKIFYSIVKIRSGKIIWLSCLRNHYCKYTNNEFVFVKFSNFGQKFF